jgi:hypothetical protein
VLTGTPVVVGDSTTVVTVVVTATVVLDVLDVLDVLELLVVVAPATVVVGAGAAVTVKPVVASPVDPKA